MLVIADYLFDATSIFNPIYLFSSLMLTILWLVFIKNNSFLSSFKIIYSAIIWRSNSVVLDLKLSLLNFVLLRPFVIGVEASLFLTTYIFLNNYFFTWHFNYELPLILDGILVTLFTMLAVDFAAYIVHRYLHHPFLWSIHSVHHEATSLNPLTTYRQHPIEPVLLYSARGVFEGVALAFYHFIFPAQTSVITYFGIGIGFLFYMFTVNLHHWPIPIRYPNWLSTVLISPHHHQIHHSSYESHFNRNYGVIFSIWDRMFGTYCDDNIELGSLQFGLKNQIPKHSLGLALLKPFEAFRFFTNRRRY